MEANQFLFWTSKNDNMSRKYTAVYGFIYNRPEKNNAGLTVQSRVVELDNIAVYLLY